MDALSELYTHAQGRSRPEDVADTILRVIGPRLDVRARRLLQGAARGSLAHRAGAYSSMATEFFRAQVQPAQQVSAVRVLMAGQPLRAELPALSDSELRDPQAVRRFVELASPLLHRHYGDARRLDKRARFALGLMKGHRWYGKRFRLLRKLEEKIDRMIRSDKRYSLSRVAKSCLATKLPFALFARDLDSACFIAYFTARMSLRSVFTNGSQERPFDEIAAALLAHCERGTPCWLAIAHAMPDRDVARRLYDEERGQLLAAAFDVMVDAAEFLREVYVRSTIDRATMIVRRGDDSSTWNEAAGAWNKAREAWITLLHALGMDGLLDAMLPGKALRLMAADVAYWHRASGGGLHPDTPVFAALPLPWEVLSGEAVCTRRMVEAACEAHGASLAGWVGPKERREAVPFSPTPELVHGVTVTSAALAKTLRKLGVFAGPSHTLKPSEALESVEVLRDPHGFALVATDKQ
ncbi:MAG: hypothetical protein U0271_39350 [Polyangiaceae bacterium]